MQTDTTGLVGSRLTRAADILAWQYTTHAAVLARPSYFRVVEAFPVFAKLGICESRAYAGSSMIYGRVYGRLLLLPGDEIHALQHDTRIVTARGACLPICTALSERSVFERGYPPRQLFPLAALIEIPRDRTRAVSPLANEPVRFTVPAEKLEPIGRSIDWLSTTTTTTTELL